MQRLSKMHLLQDMGAIAERFFSKKFYIHAKKMNHLSLQRKRLYENQKYKISFRLIPDTYNKDEHL